MTNAIQLDKLLILKLNKFATGILTRYPEMNVYTHLPSVLTCTAVGLGSSRENHAQNMLKGLERTPGI